MNKEFIPYEQAIELKELGFDKPCFGYYYTTNGKDWQFAEKSEYYRLDDEINIGSKFSLSAPTFSQAFRWFREKYNLLGNVYSNASGWLWEIHDNIGGTHRFGSEWSGDCEESGMFTSFEKAELECLIKLIEIVKENKQ
jgi:hypothetical protein